MTDSTPARTQSQDVASPPQPMRVFRFALVERKVEILEEIMREHITRHPEQGERLEFVAELVVLLEAAREKPLEVEQGV